MVWSWLTLVLFTYPWLLAADLLSDWSAPSWLVVFISGAAIVAPCRRLRRWQAVLFSGCVGFLFEARRPVPDGALALFLVATAVFLTTNRTVLRNQMLLLRSAALCNSLACTAWFTASALALTRTNSVTWPTFGWQLLLQTSFAALLGLVLYVPISNLQNWLMDKAGVAPAVDAP